MLKNLVLIKIVRWIREKAGDADGAGNDFRKCKRC